MSTVAIPRRAWARARGGELSAEHVLAELACLVEGEGGRRRALAAVAGRLVAMRGWERLGFARQRDYAVERAGVSARQIQELARVDAALAGFPVIEGALIAGGLSWTKARLLCRVATSRDESAWCAVAADLSARELGREVRRVDARAAENGETVEPGVTGGEPQEEPRETVRLRCSDGVRGRWLLACRVAERAAGGSLPRWACVEAVAAEAFAAVGLGPEGLPPAASDSSDSSESSVSSLSSVSSDSSALSNAAHLASLLARAPEGSPSPLAPPADPLRDALLEGLGEADAFELDARLRRGLRMEQRRLARIGPLLLRVASERLFRDLGYRSFDAYVRDELALCPSTARALLRIERLALASEAFRRAWRRGRVTWSQANALAPLLALEHSLHWHGAWVARAARVTVRRLKDDVDDAVARGELDPARLPDLPPGLRTGAPPRRSGGRVWLRISVPRSVARLFSAVVARVQRRIG